MTFNFNQIALMLVLFIFYTLIVYVYIYRKFNRFMIEQQSIHEQALRTAFIHHQESSLSETGKLDN